MVHQKVISFPRVLLCGKSNSSLMHHLIVPCQMISQHNRYSFNNKLFSNNYHHGYFRTFETKNTDRYKFALPGLGLIFYTMAMFLGQSLSESNGDESTKKIAKTDKTQNNLDKKKKIEAKEEEKGLPDMSRPRYSVREYPGLTRIVGDTLEEVVSDSNKDVSLVISVCGNERSKHLAIIYYQVAEALRRVDTLTIGQIKSKVNYKKDFMDSNPETPSLKFYPAGNKGKAIIYEGEYNAESIIRFIHQNATHSFDINHVLQLSKKLNSKTSNRLQKIWKDDPLRAVILASPCGASEWGYFEADLLQHFIPCKKHKRWSSLMQTAQEACWRRNDLEVTLYYDRMLKMGMQNLETDED